MTVENLIETYFPKGLVITLNPESTIKSYTIEESSVMGEYNRLEEQYRSGQIGRFEIGRLKYSNGYSYKVSVVRSTGNKRYSIKPIDTKRFEGSGNTIEEAIDDFVTNVGGDNPVRQHEKGVPERNYEIMFSSDWVDE